MVKDTARFSFGRLGTDPTEQILAGRRRMQEHLDQLLQLLNRRVPRIHHRAQLL